MTCCSDDGETVRWGGRAGGGGGVKRWRDEVNMEVDFRWWRGGGQMVTDVRVREREIDGGGNWERKGVKAEAEGRSWQGEKETRGSAIVSCEL